MSVKNLVNNNRGGEVLRSGLLKKLKTSRKKWFVLRAETPESSARLEYYDSEKKFNIGQAPKRSIPLKTCFNINKRNDTKHKHVIALYTKDDCFCVVLDTEEDLDGWLKALLSLQHGEEAADGEVPKPTFEHVWQVAILNRGLGTGRIGNYRLCLTDKTLSLIKKDCQNSVINLNLSNIRSCGSLKNYFFLEVGRSSLLGAGELWMESEDTNIAQNIHSTIFHAMSTNSKHDEMRTRSSSATESSKPNNTYRKQVVSGVPKTTSYFTQTGGGSSSTVGMTINHQRTQSLPLTDHQTITNAPLATTDYTPLYPSSRVTSTTSAICNKRSNQSSKCRERCDSMPSRPRTTSEGTHPLLPSGWRPYLTPHHRSHARDISQHSPPSGSPMSPPSVGSSSTGSTYSLTDDTTDNNMCNDCPDTMRYNGPLTPDEAIVEEDCPESPCGMYDSYVPMTVHSSDDGYVEMTPRCRRSPTVSVSSSVVSGTPSTDSRFCEYPLDKVSSYLITEHDDDDSRPARAYSVGSRPEGFRSKRQHLELAGTPEDARVRSFSMGSKTKKGPSRVLQQQHHAQHNSKSISAPILLNVARSCSNDPMDNLMEMDFSKGSNNALNNNSSKTPSGYVEMKPPGVVAAATTEASAYMDMNLGCSSSPYMDMSGSSPKNNSSSTFVDINRQYHRLPPPMNNNYVDMDHRKTKAKPLSTSSTSSSPGSHYGDYLDMSRGASLSSPKNNDYMPLSNFQQQQQQQEPARTPDGYVEMTLGSKKQHHQRQPSLEQQQFEDYLNMSVAGQKKQSQQPSSSLKPKDKTVSQPISIQHPTTTAHSMTKSSSSPISSFSSLLGRKSSTGTPPKMHLPLSSWSTMPYASLPRQRARKDSRDSSSSSLTTPSSSSTIFPLSLNSPSSPMKPVVKNDGLKIPAAIFNAIYKAGNKASSTAAGSSGGDYACMDFEAGKKSGDGEDVKKLTTSDYVNFAPAAIASDDYAVMRPGVVETSRVNPQTPVRSSSSLETGTSPLIGHLSLRDSQSSSSSSMCFRPIKEDAKLSDDSSPPPPSVSDDALAARLADSPSAEKPTSSSEGSEHRSSGECVSPAAKISRPNSVDGDKKPPTTRTPIDKSGAGGSRPSSTSSELWSSSSTLVDSRPESVNSADSAPTTTENNKLHYASLDLAQAQDEEDDSSCSPRGGAAGESSVESTFVYAEIDFMKSSDGLKQNQSQSLPTNTKVKH